jgi:lipopolysaccharide/colanic/teichoic acid biosynthesis glycosyltransferase
LTWRPIGILDDRTMPGRMIDQVPILGRPRDFRRVLGRLSLQGMRPRRIIITAPHHELGLEAIRALRKEAHAERIPVDNLPDLLRFRGDSVGPQAEGEQEILAAIAALERRSYFGVKRLGDIVASLAVLAGLALPLAVIALALRASIGSPVLFRQVRPGRGRVPFVLYKFRTMHEAFAPDGRPLDDSLRTPWIGWLLRRMRLDELPQFWNVLIGDMSIIGPRPLLEQDLTQLPDGGRERCALRPGITGWAQVHGGQQLGPEEKSALDLWYVRHASFRLDLKIALLTLRMMALGETIDEAEVERAKAALTPAGSAAARPIRAAAPTRPAGKNQDTPRDRRSAPDADAGHLRRRG